MSSLATNMMEALSDRFGQDEFVKLGLASSTIEWDFEHVEEAPYGWKITTYGDFIEALVAYEDAFYSYALDHTFGDIWTWARSRETRLTSTRTTRPTRF